MFAVLEFHGTRRDLKAVAESHEDAVRIITTTLGYADAHMEVDADHPGFADVMAFRGSQMQQFTIEPIA